MSGKKTAASYAAVHELSVALGLDPAAQRRAAELAGLAPDRQTWRRYLDRFLMAMGTLLIVAGITAFFAWNWAALAHMAKFALIQAALVGTLALVWRFGLDSVAGRASLFAAAFLVGVLLALFGQVYQTGADPYGLFLAWALFILPWALVGRQSGLWMLILVLLNLTLIMYWTQVLHPPAGLWELNQLLGPLVWLSTTMLDWRLAGWVFLLNAAAVAAWELLMGRVAWMGGRSLPRLAGIIALSCALIPTLALIFELRLGWYPAGGLLTLSLFTMAAGVSLWYYQFRRLDLFMLTGAAFAVIAVVMAVAIRTMFDELGSLLVLALLLIAQVAAAAFWLRGLSRRGEAGS